MERDDSRLKQQVEESARQYQKQEYREMVNQLKPRPTYLKNAFWAFVVGGLIIGLSICCIAAVFILSR
mgnify:CR=1 FL=1